MAGPNVPQLLSRRRPPQTGNEEASGILRLGEFTDTPTLSVAEANVLLQHIIHQREQVDDAGNRAGAPFPSTDVFTKTREYLGMFARFKGQRAVTQVSATLDQWVKEGRITHFEKAQLGTLCCDTVEEAHTLVPSLEGKISDDDLQQVLDDIAKLRDFS